MGAITTLTLADSATTTVTFNPNKKKGDVALWKNVATNSFLQKKIEFTSTDVNAGTRVRRPKLVIGYPYVETDINGVNTIKSGYFNIECTLPRNMPAADITKLRTLVISALSNAMFSDAIDNDENPY